MGWKEEAKMHWVLLCASNGVTYFIGTISWKSHQ